MKILQSGLITITHRHVNEQNKARDGGGVVVFLLDRLAHTQQLTGKKERERVRMTCTTLHGGFFNGGIMV